MRKAVLVPAVLAIAAAVLLFSMNRGSASGPPTIVLGVDKCHFCHMVIVDRRYAAMYYSEAEGRWLKFDDIGCMLSTMAELGEFDAEAYVHDYESSAPIPARTAWYVVADPARLRTPMSSGVVALADRARAEALARRLNGTVTDWDGLTRMYREGKVTVAAMP